MDPSVRAWLGFAGILPCLPADEYLTLIGSYQRSKSSLSNHARGLELKQARLDAMPPRDEVVAYIKSHSFIEARLHFKVSNRRMYEWKIALGLVKRRT